MIIHSFQIFKCEKINSHFLTGSYIFVMYALWVLINFSGFIILKIFYDDNISWMIYFGSQSFTLHNLMEPEDLKYDKNR